MFTLGLTRALDDCAPIKTIQNRNNYAPNLQETTKDMMELRNVAQRKAAVSGSQEDWRQYRGLRNQCVAAQRMDRKNWEKSKLNRRDNNPTQVWKSVKSIIGWGSTGPPTKLYHKGEYVSSPAGLATTMNKFFIEKVSIL